MATYNGINIFGPVVSIQVIDNPPAAQIAAFFGVPGEFLLFGGQRGRVFTVEGVLTADSLADLAAAEALFRSYNDGIGRILVDTKGTSWPSVVYQRYEPTGKWRYLAGGVGMAQPYKALFAGLL